VAIQKTPEQARLGRVRKALANPVYLAEQYVRPSDPSWITPTPEFGKQMLAFSLRHERAVVQLPPEFMKTTLLSQVLPLWLTLTWTVQGKLLRGLLLAEEERMAMANLNVLKWHLRENERIVSDFVDRRGNPLVYPDPKEAVWREDAIIVARKGTSKDPTWQAKGLDSKGIHGRRLDWIIGDDVITPKNAASPALRKQALDVMDNTLRNRVVKGGHILMAGNFNDDKDLLSTLAKRPRWKTFRRPAMSKPGQPEVPAKESELATADLLWEDAWDRERLMTEYRETPNRFRRIFLLDPRAEHGERLNVGWVTLIQPDATPLQLCRFFMALDAALGEGESDDLDFFNITVLALHDLHVDLVESHDVRTALGRSLTLVGHMHDRYQRLGYGVAAIGGAKQVVDRVVGGAFGVLRKDLRPKLHDVSIPGSKELRLEGLGPMAESGWLRIWEPVWTAETSSPDDRHQELSLFEQWRDFPFINHDDKLDGLDVGLRTVQDLSLLGDQEIDLVAAE
jgi:hypothetical protein